MLLLTAFLNLVFCLVVSNNSWGKSLLLKFFAPNVKVVPSLFLTASFSLLNCKFVSLTFILVYSTIYTMLFNKI